MVKTGRRPVIFYRGAGLGDIICTIPAVNELKKRHPGATFIYNCRKDFSAIPQLAGLAGLVTSLGPMSSVNHWYGFLLGGYYEFNNGDPMLARLGEHGFTNVVQLGISRYQDKKPVVIEPIPGVVSLVDQLTLEESVAVVACARLHIGVDSGLLHVAAATGVSSVGLFGMTLPQRIFPKISNQQCVVTRVECRGCGHYNAANPYTDDCPHHIRCMHEISVEEVLNACLAGLKAAQ